MPSSLWFDLKYSGCFSFDSKRSYEKEFKEIQKDVIEARNGCHELHTTMNKIRDAIHKNEENERKQSK